MTRRQVVRAAALWTAALIVAGCVPSPIASRGADDTAGHGVFSPSTVPVNADTRQLHATSPERVARRVTVRVRAVGCGRIGTASAVAVGRRLLVTNRHVVAGADRIELNFWDGTAASARLQTVAVADDLALVRVSRRLPAVARVAESDADKGTAVLIVGFPKGGEQSVAKGELIEYAPLERHPDASPVMRLSAPVEPGNSGGPVFDQSGAVVGVVFGIETATGNGLAIPSAAIRDLLDDRDAGGRSPGCP